MEYHISTVKPALSTTNLTLQWNIFVVPIECNLKDSLLVAISKVGLKLSIT